MTWLSASTYMLSGYTLMTAASRLARALGAFVNPSPLHKLASGLVAAVFLVCVSSFPLRVGLGSVGLYLDTLGPLLALLGIIGAALLVNDLRRSGALRKVTPEGVVYGAVLVSLLVVISYLFVTQSVDTNYDFYYANYKAIGWALHDGNMANPLLQPLYDQRGFPAYWSYVALDGVLGQGSCLFSVMLAALLTLCLTVYAFAKEHFGREAGMAASLVVLASPLTFLYSYRGLDMDLMTYSAVFLAFYATLKALRRDEGSVGWGLLAGVSSGVALMADPKGFIVLLMVPAAAVIASKSRILKALWAVAAYCGLSYVLAGPMSSAGLSGWAYAAVLLPLAVPFVVLYGVMTSADGHGAFSAVNSRGILAFALGVSPALVWHSFFGYIQLWLRPIPSSVPSAPVTVSYSLQYLVNAPNMLYAFVGLFSYPFYGAPLVLLGLAVTICAFLRDREEHLAQLLSFAIIAVLSVYVFAYASIDVDNWRYFYLLVPFGTVLIAGALARIGGTKRLVPLSAAFTAGYVFTLLPGALAFNGSSLWFSNAIPGMGAWLDLAWLPWAAGAALMALAYLILMSSETHAARLRGYLSHASRRRHLLAGLAAGALALVLAAAVVAPFAPFMQRTAFADISEVRDTGPTWNAGLRAPFEYLAQERASFGGSAFLTYAAYGIEYYAGIPSLDMNQSAQVAPLQPYLNDTSALRAFLLDHGMRYALFPLQTNNASDIGPSAYEMMSRTALGGLIGDAKILKSWDGWALYDLAQG